MTPWDKFSKEKLSKIISEKKAILDIGGGLRISRKKGNRYDESNKWISDLIAENKVDYRILDPVSDFSPDVVGDIHNLPFADNSLDSIICVSVLEHVADPFKASQEMFRVLKTGGYCFLYIPFLYYFHAEKGYYSDYWRFTEPAIRLLFKDFSSLEIKPVRGALGTWIKLTPLGRYKMIEKIFYFFDLILNKLNSKQTSGYCVFLTK